MRIEFFFDCSSPWTYLAFELLQPIAERHEAEIVWRPFLVGGVFNAVNPGAGIAARDALPPAKRAYFDKDLVDWTHYVGIPLHFPPTGHPVSSVKVMRGCVALQADDRLVAFARATFRAYFERDRPIADDAVIAEICDEAGVDSAWLLARIADQEVKDGLRANTEEAIARGAFGSPTFFIDGDDMYFGVDRLPLVEKRLSQPM